MTPEEQKNLYKQAVKEALKEWMDDKMKELGYNVFKWFAWASVLALTALILWSKGYRLGI